ncbi:MAG: OmpA family protein, partial [Dysgonamonadaceae bacterium]|nr:OmpA family protein [Dysgonamonadaceae bacterium]
GDHINIPLSEKRADSVKYFLTGQGVASNRMVTAGMGSSQKIAEENSRGVQALNRRVEIYILPNEKMLRDANAGTLR